MSTIGVIVPVYKVEPYLRQCIDSILTQTFADFELILVDDGSPDNCGAVCDEYAAKDSRVVVIHQENGGLSAARNAGIDWVFANSDSEWITFVDSDDCLSEVCLERLYDAAVESGADISVTNGHCFTDDHELVNAPQNVVAVRTMTGRESCMSFYKEEGLLGDYAWGKLYKREILEAYRFPAGKVFEDEALVPKLMYCAGSVAVMRSWLYRYRQREGSIVHESFSLTRYDHIEALDSCIQFFTAYQESEIVKMIEDRKRKCLSRYTLEAHRAKLAHRIPAPYRMPIWKALVYTINDTVHRGGVDFVRKRACNLLNKIRKK